MSTVIRAGVSVSTGNRTGNRIGIRIRGLRVSAFWYRTRPATKSLLPVPTRMSNFLPDSTGGFTRCTRTRMPRIQDLMELTIKVWFGSAYAEMLSY